MMEAGGYSRLLALCRKMGEAGLSACAAPTLPQRGFAPGPKLGAALKKLEAEWVASGFVAAAATRSSSARRR